MGIIPCNDSSSQLSLEKKELGTSDPKLHEKIQNQPLPLEGHGFSYWKWLKYEGSLVWTQVKGLPWWSKMGEHNLYLGGLPLKEHLQQLKELGVTDVICLVEDFELKSQFQKPVQKEDWDRAGIQVHYIPAVDFEPLTKEQFEKAVNLLDRLLKEGKTVYLHCKAGVGRSASVAVAHLVQNHHMTFEEALAFATNHRSHINLNPHQRQAIIDYVQKTPSLSTQNLSEERFAKILTDMLDLIIEGFSPKVAVPETLKGWVPPLQAESTLSRRNRYLKNSQGNQEIAVIAAIENSHNIPLRKITTSFKYVPVVGAPTSFSFTLWFQLREIALIAALYGHDLKDPTVRMQILSCLLEGNVMKGPAQTLDLIAKKIAKELLLKVGISSFPGAALPAHLIFNYLTDNAAKVSTYAQATFGGDHSKPISEKEYSP